MKLTDLFKATGEPFSYYPGLVHQFGISVNASVFLCYIAWKTFPDEADGWKPISTELVTRATGLSIKEQATARRQLVAEGIIEEHYARLEHSLKFRILAKHLTGESPSADVANGDLLLQQMATPPKGESSNKQEGNREEPQKRSVSVGEGNGDQAEQEAEGNPPQTEPNPKTAAAGVTAEDIYEAYPLKVGRPVALKAIQKAMLKKKPEDLLALTKQFKAARNGDKTFVPHPATWFNQERYNDSPATWVRAGTPAPTPPANRSIPGPRTYTLTKADLNRNF